MNGIGFEILVILILILANGVFALAEIALVSSRKHRLQKKADEGSCNAVIALKLANEPNELLSAVQIGITLVGTIAGAFGGATVAEELAAKLNAIPQIDPHGESIALAAVVFAITGLSIILGELVPKRLALTNPEMFASTMAPFMKMLTRFASPVVRVLGWSTDQVLKLLPIPSSEGTAITEEEIRVLIKQGTKAGTFAETKLEMVEGVFQLGDRRVIELMLPRSKIVWLDINSDLDAIRNAIISSPCSRFPVAAGDLDHILGFVHVKDLLGQCLTGQPVDLKPCVRQLPAMPEMMTALKALELFQNSGTHVALVVNEHGGTKGLIEFNDVIEAIVGELPAAGEKPEQQANQREDGSWLIDGGMPVFEFKELLGISRLPGEDVSAYTTLGGFILMQLGRIPLAGDRVEVAGWRYEVVDMDRNRIDKLLISKSLSPPDADNERDSD